MKIVIFFLIAANIFGQKDPYKILDDVKKNFEKIEDYQVDVNVKINVDFLKVPETNAKIYFKKPDKMKFDSEGFALLPKQSMNFSPAQLLNFEYDALYVGIDTIDNSVTDEIKILPKSDTTNLVLSTLWIDRDNDVVKKVVSTTKNSGTFQVSISYGENVPLPSEVKFEFNIEDMNIPHSITGEPPAGESSKNKDEIKGSVIITYHNYKINQGIDDEFFEDKDEE